MALSSFSKLGFLFLKLLIEQGFYFKYDCDLHLWLYDLKIIRGHLLAMGNDLVVLTMRNVSTKFHKPRLIISQVMDKVKVLWQTSKLAKHNILPWSIIIWSRGIKSTIWTQKPPIWSLTFPNSLIENKDFPYPFFPKCRLEIPFK